MVEVHRSRDAGIQFVLIPNCSCTWPQCKSILWLTAIPSTAIGLGFASLGFWPILPLCGAEVLALAAGFYVSAHRQRRYEILALSEDEVTVAWEERSGKREQRWQRAFAQFIVREEENDEGPRLFLRSHGVETELASRLNGDDRRKLVATLKTYVPRSR